MIGGETYVRRAREPFHPLSPLLFHFAGERNEEFSCSGEQQRCRRRRCTYGRSHTAGATREKERERKQQVSPALPPPFPSYSPRAFFPREGLRLSSPSSSFEGTDNPSLFTSCVLLSPSLFYVGAGGRAGMRIYLFLRWHKKMLSPEESDFASALSHDSVCTRTHVTRTDKY